MSSPEESDVKTEGPAPEGTFKILVATDVHLGYEEKHPIRGQDSFVTFEEILQQAVKNEVDFLLLGGDLFHESRPSPYCMHKCLELLRRYCLGSKPVSIEFLSDQSNNFQFLKVPIVNYEDPNLNIAIPVFSIHGNHDDPSGHKQVSALDVLASTGLFNYFGRWNDLSKVEVQPILLQKGKTKLALYGLSHIKDERLGRLFREKKVYLKKPVGDDWFNLMVLHQNRAARGVKNFIPDSALPDIMHLVVWGHEHDCRIQPEKVENGVYICQPGSSVATSLSIGESVPKNIGLLQVFKESFKIVPLPLMTVRPFLIDELILENPQSDNYSSVKPADQAVKQVIDKVDQMIAEAALLHKDLTKPPPLPLLRLKVFYYTEQQQFNAVRIGMNFGGRVANPESLVKINSLVARERKQKTALYVDEDDCEKFVNINEWATSVEDVVLKFFEKEENKKAMSVLSAKGLTEAVTRYVRYSDLEAISVIIEKQLKNTVKQLIQMDPDVNKIEEAVNSLRDQRQSGDPENQVINISDDGDDSGLASVKTENHQIDEVDDYLASTDDEVAPASTSKKPSPPKGRGGRGSRGRGATRARAGSRGRRGKKDSCYGSLDSFCK